MSLNEILEQLPKLSVNEKRQLWNVLDHELGGAESDEESPEFLAELDERIQALDSGEKTYTIDEVRQHIDAIIGKHVSGSEE